MRLRDANVVKEVVSIACSAIVRCTICQENVKSPMLLQCKDVFCNLCLKKYLEASPNKPLCPNCNAVINKRACYSYPDLEDTPFHKLIRNIETTMGVDWATQVKEYKIPSGELSYIHNVKSIPIESPGKLRNSHLLNVSENTPFVNELSKNNITKKLKVEIVKIAEGNEKIGKDNEIIENDNEKIKKKNSEIKLPRNYFRQPASCKSNNTWNVEADTSLSTKTVHLNRCDNVKTYKNKQRVEIDLKSFSQHDDKMIFPGEIVSIDDYKPEKKDIAQKPTEKVIDWLQNAENDFDRNTLTQATLANTIETNVRKGSTDEAKSVLQLKVLNQSTNLNIQDEINSAFSEKSKSLFELESSSDEIRKENSYKSGDSLQVQMNDVFDELVLDIKENSVSHNKNVTGVIQCDSKRYSDSVFELFYSQTLNNRRHTIDSIENESKKNESNSVMENRGKKLRKKPSEDWSRLKKSQLSRTEKTFRKLNVSIESSKRAQPLELKKTVSVKSSSEEIIIDEFDSLEKDRRALLEIDKIVKVNETDKEVCNSLNKINVDESPINISRQKNITVEESPNQKNVLINVDCSLNRSKTDQDEVHSDLSLTEKSSVNSKKSKNVFKFFRSKSKIYSEGESELIVSDHNNEKRRVSSINIDLNENDKNKSKSDNISLRSVVSNSKMVVGEEIRQESNRISDIHNSKRNEINCLHTSSKLARSMSEVHSNEIMTVPIMSNRETDCSDLNASHEKSCTDLQQMSLKEERSESKCCIIEKSRQTEIGSICTDAARTESVEHFRSNINKKRNNADFKQNLLKSKQNKSLISTDDRSSSSLAVIDCNEIEGIVPMDSDVNINIIESEKPASKQVRSRSSLKSTERFKLPRKVSEEELHLDVVQTLPDRFSDILKPLNYSDTAVPILRLMEKLPTCHTFTDLLNELDEFSQSLREKIENENSKRTDICVQTENYITTYNTECPKCSYCFGLRIMNSGNVETFKKIEVSHSANLNKCRNDSNIQNETLVLSKLQENDTVSLKGFADVEITRATPVDENSHDIWETETVILKVDNPVQKVDRCKLADTQVLIEPTKSTTDKHTNEELTGIDFDNDCFDTLHTPKKNGLNSRGVFPDSNPFKSVSLPVVDIDKEKNLSDCTADSFEDLQIFDSTDKNTTVVLNPSQNVLKSCINNYSKDDQEMRPNSNRQHEELDKTLLIPEREIQCENNRCVQKSATKDMQITENVYEKDLYPEVIIKNIDKNTISSINNTEFSNNYLKTVNRHLSFDKPEEIFNKKCYKRNRSPSNSDLENEARTPKKNRTEDHSDVCSSDCEVIESTPQKNIRMLSSKLYTTSQKNTQQTQSSDDNNSDIVPLSDSSAMSMEIAYPSYHSMIEGLHMDHLHRTYTPPFDFQDSEKLCVLETEDYRNQENCISSDNDVTLVPETEQVFDTIIPEKCTRNVSVIPNMELLKNLKTPTPNIDILKLKTRTIQKWPDSDSEYVIAESCDYNETPRLSSNSFQKPKKINHSTPKENFERNAFQGNNGIFTDYDTPKTSSCGLNKRRVGSILSNTNKRVSQSNCAECNTDNCVEFNTSKPINYRDSIDGKNNDTYMDCETFKFSDDHLMFGSNDGHKLSSDNLTSENRKNTLEVSDRKSCENADKSLQFGIPMTVSQECVKSNNLNDDKFSEQERLEVSECENHFKINDHNDFILNNQNLSSKSIQDTLKLINTELQENFDKTVSSHLGYSTHKNTEITGQNKINTKHASPLSELKMNLIQSPQNHEESSSEKYESPIKNTEDYFLNFETPKANKVSGYESVSKVRENHLDVSCTEVQSTLDPKPWTRFENIKSRSNERSNSSGSSKQVSSKEYSPLSINTVKSVTTNHQRNDVISRQKSMWNYVDKSRSGSSQHSKKSNSSDNSHKSQLSNLHDVTSYLNQNTSNNNQLEKKLGQVSLNTRNENMVSDSENVRKSNEMHILNQQISDLQDCLNLGEHQDNALNTSVLIKESKSDNRNMSESEVTNKTGERKSSKQTETLGFDMSFCLPNSFVSQNLIRNVRNVPNIETQPASMHFATPNSQMFKNPVANSTPKIRKDNDKICISCSRLSDTKTVILRKFCIDYGIKFQADNSTEITHLIMETNTSGEITDLTLKYISAVANGRWVLSFDWILACNEKKEIIAEEPYEALDNSGFPGPKMSRLADKSFKLLADFDLSVVEPMVTCTVEDIQSIVISAGARVFKNPEQMAKTPGRICVVVTESSNVEEWHVEKFQALYEKHGIVTVDFEWISQSICQYRVLSFVGWLLSENFTALDDYPSYLRIETQDYESEM